MVDARPAVEAVREAVPSPDRVSAGAAVDRVAADVALELVVPWAAVQDVVAALTVDPVVAAEPTDHFAAGRAEEDVRPARARDRAALRVVRRSVHLRRGEKRQRGKHCCQCPDSIRVARGHGRVLLLLPAWPRRRAGSFVVLIGGYPRSPVSLGVVKIPHLSDLPSG